MRTCRSWAQGREEVRRLLATRFEGIPDAHWGDDRHAVCGERGFSEWTLTGTSQRNLDPTIFEPELAGNLTLIIQGLVVLIVSADVIVLEFCFSTPRIIMHR